MKMNIPYSYKFAERFLIFTTLASFLCCLLSILRDFTTEAGKNIISIPTIALCAVYALIVFSIIAIFFNQQTKLQNSIRLVIYYTVATGIITWFLRGFVNFPIVTIATIAGNILYQKLFIAFFEHDCFENQCVAKNNTTLKKELYDYSIHLSEAANGYRQNRFILIILAVILSILSGIAISQGTRFSLLTVILLLVYIVCLYIHLFLYSYYVREAVFASDGFVNVFDFRKKVILVCTLIFTGAFVLGLLISSNHSPLKVSYLFLFLRFFKRDPDAVAAPAKDIVTQDLIAQRLDELSSFQQQMEEDDTGGTFTFAIICGAFFVIGILWFLLSPFIKRVFSKALRNTDFRKIFKNIFGEIKAFFKNLFKRKIRFPVVNTESARLFSKEMEEYLKFTRKSKEKKAELDRLTKQFMKIIDRGTANGVEYTKNLAPAEYTELLNNENAITAGALFEKALYDKECLTKEEEKSFYDNVDCFVGRYAPSPQ